MKRHLITAYMVAVGILGTAYFVLDPTPTNKLLLYNGVGLLGLTGTIVGIRIHRPKHRAPWILFALGQASFLTADLIYYWLDTHSDSVRFPSVADGFYLLMYPLVITGLALMIRRFSNGSTDWPGLIDAGLFGIALFSTLWVLVLDSYVQFSGQGTTQKLISIGYPVMDLAVLFLAVRLAVMVRHRHSALGLMIGALCCLVIADVQYGVLNAANSFKTGTVVDAFWLGFYTLFALAALHPSMAKEIQTSPNQHERITNGRLGLMFVATLTVPFIDTVWGDSKDRLVTQASSALLFALMIGRVLGLVRSVEQGRALLHREARHDPLTSLANRTMFAERTRSALQTGRNKVAVLLIDLDDFKAVNDSLGHEAGDEVLTTVANRIRRCVRDSDLVARLGGDEFAVLITKTIDTQDAANTAARIIRALSEPITVLDRQVRVGGSVGVAMHSQENDDVQSLLRGADVAMYLAKRQGKGCYAFFEQSQYSEIIDRLNLKADLEQALANEEFVIHYQPIVDTDSAVIRSVEALLRWQHPERGMIPPDQFIPLAEETGEINAIGRWVLAETCRQVRDWQLTIPHCGELRASVNLSGRQLGQQELLHGVTDALRMSGLSPEHLTLEVTESLLVADSNSTRTLEQLTALKVKIAIDDFGTGYSSLAYLHSFPVDTIKIDKSFVQKLDDSETSRALVRTVIDLARAVGGTTVAEGVENQRQLDILSDLKCDLVQGFLFSRPLPASDFASLLMSRNQKDQLLPLPARSTASKVTRRASGQAEIIRGVRQVEAIVPSLAKFHHYVDAPITARWPWLSPWFQLHPEADMVCLLVRSTNDRIEGAAILARQPSKVVTRVFSVDNQMANVSSIFARNEKAADSLARGIADLALSTNGSWCLELDQISGSNKVAEALASLLPGASVETQLPVPQVLLHAGLTLNDVLSKGMRKRLRRSHARLDSHAPGWQIDFHRGTGAIMPMLPEIEAIHISRDHARRNESDLDDALARRFWQETVVTHAYTDELELATLTVNGDIAAYVMSLIDGSSYRVFDGRMNTAFAEFSPGRVLEAAALDRALSDDAFTIFDWMTGVAPETIMAANHWQPRSRLTARSVDELIVPTTTRKTTRRGPRELVSA